MHNMIKLLCFGFFLAQTEPHRSLVSGPISYLYTRIHLSYLQCTCIEQKRVVGATWRPSVQLQSIYMYTVPFMKSLSMRHMEEDVIAIAAT